MTFEFKELMVVYKALYNRLMFLQNHPDISRWEVEYRDCSELHKKLRQYINHLQNETTD